MLKKIPVSDVRLGMHLHALEGAWLDHPFWKTRFVLRDAQQLALLRGSAVQEVWIDTDQGLDVEATAARVKSLLEPQHPKRDVEVVILKPDRKTK